MKINFGVYKLRLVLLVVVLLAMSPIFPNGFVVAKKVLWLFCVAGTIVFHLAMKSNSKSVKVLQPLTDLAKARNGLEPGEVYRRGRIAFFIMSLLTPII